MKSCLGFLANRGTTLALWRTRVENDKRRGMGDEWVWLSMDIRKAFDTVIRDVGLAAARDLGVDPRWTDIWTGLWDGLDARLRMDGELGGKVK